MVRSTIPQKAASFPASNLASLSVEAKRCWSLRLGHKFVEPRGNTAQPGARAMTLIRTAPHEKAFWVDLLPTYIPTRLDAIESGIGLGAESRRQSKEDWRRSLTGLEVYAQPGLEPPSGRLTDALPS